MKLFKSSDKPSRRNYDRLKVTEEMFVHSSEKDSRKYMFAMLQQILDHKERQLQFCNSQHNDCNKRFKRLETIGIIIIIAFISVFPNSWIIQTFVPWVRNLFL